MTQREIERNGRKYLAHVSPDVPEGAYVVIGPPDGLVDELGLPEPFATTLHNILFDRKIFTYADASRPKVMMGVLQETLGIDAQKIIEKFYLFEKESEPVMEELL